jgi:predicted ArsR family transcriptional regulator
MDWLNTLAGETRARLLRLVRHASSSIAELAQALGISENAVRTHVAAAERDGLVRAAGVQRSTGGKPARIYELTPAAEELFPKAYALVLAEVIRTLREEDGDAAAVERLRRVGRRLAAGAAGGAVSDEEGVAAAATLLNAIGGSVEVTRARNGWTLESDGCPLSGVVSAEPKVCALAESLVAELTGLTVRETCRKEGRPRCAFRVAEDGAE